jgi:hypothetical protein
MQKTSTQYIGRHTLIVGDLNSGKTTRTALILHDFVESGHGTEIAVLDLAPDPIRGIGGKLDTGRWPDLFYVTAPIKAPRLMGKNETHSLYLARQNARTIETLFLRLPTRPKSILFVNDATLYLQAGEFSRFKAVLDQYPTAVINAYYGRSFPETPLTMTEKERTLDLIKISDLVIEQV